MGVRYGRYPVSPIWKKAFGCGAGHCSPGGAVPGHFGVALLVYFTMGRPVFFRQYRPGLHGKPFLLCKFRTMLELYDDEGKPLPDEKRLTKLGKFLRRTSLDELPELWNILRGEMSFVGPRPLLMEYLSRYTPEQARRHEVKPGLTGWVQVNEF